MFYIYSPNQRVDIRTASLPEWIAKTQSAKYHSVGRLYNKPVILSDNEINAYVNQKDQERTHMESRENMDFLYNQVGDQIKVYLEGTKLLPSCNQKPLTPNNRSSWSVELLTFTSCNSNWNS